VSRRVTVIALALLATLIAAVTPAGAETRFVFANESPYDTLDPHALGATPHPVHDSLEHRRGLRRFGRFESGMQLLERRSHVDVALPDGGEQVRRVGEAHRHRGLAKLRLHGSLVSQWAVHPSRRLRHSHFEKHVQERTGDAQRHGAEANGERRGEP